MDDHLVRPETTRDEVVRGRKMQAMPAKPPHGDRHFELDYVIRGNVAAGYVGSTDLLSRVGPGSDFATDTCIRRKGIDPSTGTRWLEELAFEVTGEQPIRNITERAEDLTARGARRMIAIFVKQSEVREWSTEHSQWQHLDPDGFITDPTLAQPLPVRALLDAVEADNVVARALKAKGNPVLAELEAETRRQALEQGGQEGLRRGIEVACAVLDIPLGADRRSLLERLDITGLEDLLETLRTERR